MQKTVLKNNLMNTRTGDVLMSWDVFRYPTNEEKEDGETVVEFAASIVDKEFGKDTFSFFSQDDENYVWLFDPEQRLSERKGEKDNENDVIVGGPTKVTFETSVEAGEYMLYVLETLSAAGFYYTTKSNEDTKQEG